jgi:thymidylate synthase
MIINLKSSFSEQFQEIINTIDGYGSESQPRDLKVRELLIGQILVNPTDVFADFESRKFNFKYFAGEVAWYLNRDRDIDYINQFSGFWKGITNPNSNEINSNYGNLLFGDQLKWVYDSLVKDQNSRQAIAFLNQPKFQFEGNKDFVCTMYLNFFIRDNELNMKVQMRSNDIFYGLTYDAPFFAFVHQHMYLWLKEVYPNLILGSYIHCADNIHYYEHHFELASSVTKEITSLRQKYTMNITEPFFILDKDGNYHITSKGMTYINRVNRLVSSDAKMSDYKNLITEFMLNAKEKANVRL